VTLASKHALVALGLLGAASFILKDALFLGGAFYQRDLLTIYVPAAEAFVRTILEGALPLRDPTTGFGQPMLGNPDAQVLYPPTWLHLILLPERVYPLFVLIHFFVGATGASALGWRFSRSSLGAFCAGGFWLVSGPLQSLLNITHHLAGAAWIPWVLTAFDRVLETPDRRRTLVLGGVFGLQILTGSADMCAITLGLASLLLLFQARENVKQRLWSQFKSAAAALAIAACLSAGVWMTVAEVSRTSLRGSMTEEVRTYWSVHPALTGEFFLPLNLAELDLKPSVRETLFEGREPFVRSLFLGPLVLPLFLAGLASISIPARYRGFAFAGALFSALVAFGKYLPVYSLVTTILPFLKIFRYPSKLMIPLSLLVAVLAGAAVSQLVRRRERWVGALVCGILMALHLALLSSADEILPSLIKSADPEVQRLSASYLKTSLLASFGSLVLLGAGLVKNLGPRMLTLAACAGMVVAVQTHSRLNPVVPRLVLRFKPESVAAVKTPELSRLYVEDYVHFPERSRRFLGRDSPSLGMKLDGMSESVAHIVAVRANLIPPVGGAWGIEYAWDMDLRGLFDRSLREMSDGVRVFEGTREFVRMLQIANVSYAVSLHTSTYGMLPLERTVSTPLKEPLLVFKVPSRLPRAYAVSGTRVVDTRTAMTAVLAADFDPAAEVIVDQGTATAISPSFKSTVRIAERKSDRVALDVTLNEPGSVVLLDGFLSGWRASIDGVSVPVRRANALFLAVAADAGNHRVVFTYRPWTAMVGLTITSLTVILLLLALVAGRRPISS
jgi:hypothetical protein